RRPQFRGFRSCASSIFCLSPSLPVLPLASSPLSPSCSPLSLSLSSHIAFLATLAPSLHTLPASPWQQPALLFSMRLPHRRQDAHHLGLYRRTDSVPFLSLSLSLSLSVAIFELLTLSSPSRS